MFFIIDKFIAVVLIKFDNNDGDDKVTSEYA